MNAYPDNWVIELEISNYFTIIEFYIYPNISFKKSQDAMIVTYKYICIHSTNPWTLVFTLESISYD